MISIKFYNQVENYKKNGAGIRKQQNEANIVEMENKEPNNWSLLAADPLLSPDPDWTKNCGVDIAIRA